MITIKYSRVSWDSQTPICNNFDDYYFNSDGGISESKYVFITPSKVTSLIHSTETEFLAIAETGFGTGLNLLTTLEQLSQAHKQPKRLHYFSSELFPLHRTDFIKAVEQWPQYKNITKQIVEQYPPAINGFHRLQLSAGSVVLTLLLGDSVECYKRCSLPFDVWYLDGFSPAKNPDMWRPELFEQLARLSKPGETTYATFTAAGHVRRSLKSAEFSVQKQPGFGKKREMIHGAFEGQGTSAYADQPWFSLVKPKQTKAHNVAIIGAGLAGCTTAATLAQRGISVTVYDSAESICSEASGNLQGALYAKLPVKPTAAGELHITGLEYTLRSLSINNCLDNHIAEQCGLLQIATSQKEEAQHQQLIDSEIFPTEVVHKVSAVEASEIAGTELASSGLYYPRSGWVSPKRYCQKLMDSENIHLELNALVNSIELAPSGHWSLSINDKRETFDHVIICNAASAKQFEQTQQLPIKPIRGQVTHAKQTNSIQPLKTVVCGASYISPPLEGTYCFGASFNLHEASLELDEGEQSTNIANSQRILPNLEKLMKLPQQLSGKVAKRCSTSDYLPIVGPVPIHDKFIERYALLRKDRKWRFDAVAPPNYDGLYVNVGHGSKGLITCPLLAEHLACMITGEPGPLPSDLSNAVHPARFTVKQLIRRAI